MVVIRVLVRVAERSLIFTTKELDRENGYYSGKVSLRATGKDEAT